MSELFIQSKLVESHVILVGQIDTGQVHYLGEIERATGISWHVMSLSSTISLKVSII